MQTFLNLDAQRAAFRQQRFLATPLAGLLVWLLLGLLALWLPPTQMPLILYIGTGSIVYVGLGLSHLTGENFLAKGRPKNTFDTLFFYTQGMSLLVFAIAIPFALADYTSLPLSLGILSGLMWLPFSWIVGHWIGAFHALSRTGLILIVWYLYPQARFVLIPFVIAGLYVFTIVVMEQRYRRVCAARVLV